MTKYRKKSAIIEAVQWTGDIESIEKIDWVKEEIEKQNIIFAVNGPKDKDAVCLIADKSDIMLKVKNMDYIVKREDDLCIVNGEYFESSYEEIEDRRNCRTDITVNLDMDTTEAEMKLEELKRSVDGINDIKYNSGIMRVITKDEYILKLLMKGMKKDKAIEIWNKISKGYNFVLSKYSHNNYIYSVEKLNDILKEDKDLDCTHKEQEQ
nr:MAG TPA: PGDYG protein [Caudoviricetes sp.]